MRRALMLRYRQSKLIRVGVLGTALIILVIAVGLQPHQLLQWATSIRHQAVFDDAGGLSVGNDVTLSGVKIGEIQDISLDGGYARVTFTTASKYRLGTQTTAHICTGTLLGQRVLTLKPAGSGRLRQDDVIPLTRTSTPYSLSEALSDFTTNTAGTDTDTLNQSLNTLSETIDRVAPQLGPTFDGLSQLSQGVNARNQTLSQLFRSASDVTAVLSQRSQQVNALILDANDLLSVLVERQHAIVELLADTSALAQQLTGVVHDNEAKLTPALQKLNSVVAVLEKDRDTIAKVLPLVSQYEITQGETVANGFFYNAFIANLNPGQILQPFLDYAFGFRRGVNAGQPPDHAGPRAELQLPHNGIPGGSR